MQQYKHFQGSGQHSLFINLGSILICDRQPWKQQSSNWYKSTGSEALNAPFYLSRSCSLIKPKIYELDHKVSWTLETSWSSYRSLNQNIPAYCAQAGTVWNQEMKWSIPCSHMEDADSVPDWGKWEIFSMYKTLLNSGPSNVCVDFQGSNLNPNPSLTTLQQEVLRKKTSQDVQILYPHYGSNGFSIASRTRFI